MSDEPIPRDKLKAAGNALRFQMLSLLNTAFAASGTSIKTVANRLDWSARKVRRVLNGDTRLTIELAAEVLFAIDGSIFVVTLEDDPRASTGEESQEVPVQDSTGKDDSDTLDGFQSSQEESREIFGGTDNLRWS